MAIVEAKAEGSVTITATNTAGLSSNKSWTVQYYPLISLTINGNTSMNVGETQQLTYSYEGYKSEIPTNVVWQSDDASVIAVSSDGVVTAVGTGTATVTMSSDASSLTASLTITVNDAQGTGIEDIPASDTGAPRKILIDDVIYILRGNKTYTLQGQEVK